MILIHFYINPTVFKKDIRYDKICRSEHFYNVSEKKLLDKNLDEVNRSLR